MGKTKLTIQINTYNILGKGNYESTNGALSLVPIGYDIMPGTPTTVMGMVKVEF